MSDIKEELAKRASSLRKKESGNEPEREEAVDKLGCEKALRLNVGYQPSMRGA